MKAKTSSGVVELTADMVCRGMVFRHGAWDLFTAGEQSRPFVWRDAREHGACAALMQWDDGSFLGCDPAIATRADCERFGVHGDAAAHGFARLRDGGAVDLRKPENIVRGMCFVDTEHGERRPVGPHAHLAELEDIAGNHAMRFLGLDGDSASPEDVGRLCCGEKSCKKVPHDGGFHWSERICTLAIGDHDHHEDLATGTAWPAKASAEQSGNWHERAAIKGTAEHLQRKVVDRALAEMSKATGGLVFPHARGESDPARRLWRDGAFVDEVLSPSPAERARDAIAAATRSTVPCARCGKPTELTGLGPTMVSLVETDPYLASSAPACASCIGIMGQDWKAWVVRDGKIVAKAASVEWHESGNGWHSAHLGKETDGGVREHAEGIGWTVHHRDVRLAGGTVGSLATAKRNVEEWLRAIASAADAVNAVLGMLAFVFDVWNRSPAGREAALVALVRSPPEWAHPVAWGAAVLAVEECHKRYGHHLLRRDEFAAWLLHSLREDMDDCDAGTPYAAGYRDYQRALQPVAKVAPERKRRGPVVAVMGDWED